MNITPTDIFIVDRTTNTVYRAAISHAESSVSQNTFAEIEWKLTLIGTGNFLYNVYQENLRSVSEEELLEIIGVNKCLNN